MRVGVIGLGWMGKVHLRVYSQMSGVEVAGVMDIDSATLDEVRAKYGVPCHRELEPLLDAGLDAVSVCVPTSMHYEIGMRIIERGIALLIEKPLAATAVQARELDQAAEKAGVPLMVGHIERFNPAVGRIKALLDEDPHVISIMIERVGPYPPRIQDVGVIRDLASHDIDLVCHLSGARYKDIFAVTSRNIGAHEDTVIINSEMENGVLAQMNCNWITPYKSRNIRVATKTRYIEGNLITQQVKEYSRFETYESSYNVREWPVLYREPVREELIGFLDAIRAGAEMPISGADGVYVLEMIEKLQAAERAS